MSNQCNASNHKAKAEAAKKRAKDGFGEGDGDWMDSDPDRPEMAWNA